MKAIDKSAELTYDLEDIVMWPNGTWCYRYEIHEMNHMSDDYFNISFGTEQYNNFFNNLKD